MYRTTLNYSAPLLRQAVLGFWWRVVGIRFLAALALVAFGFALSIHEGDTSWFTGVLGSVLVMGMLFAVALYVAHYRNVMQKLRAMRSPQATLEASDEALALSSDAGSASLPWSAITELWKLKNCWLLLLSRSQFVTLPLADLTPELKAFISEKVRVLGGKVG